MTRPPPHHRGCQPIRDPEVTTMIEHETRLVPLVQLVSRVPSPPPAARRRRGRPPTSPDRRLLPALVMMRVRHLHTGPALLRVWAQPTLERHTRRTWLTVDGRVPTRRPWERRVRASPATLPAPMGCLGRALVAVIQPWARGGRAAASDRTGRRARGGVWHQKDREAGSVPHPSLATAAHATKSGWHGWGYGWKLPLVTTVAGVWLPRAADLTAAPGADTTPALTRLPERPSAVRSGLGDQHDHDPALAAAGAQAGQTVVATRRGPSPHTDDGVGVRRLLHARRSRASANLHDPFKGIVAAHGQGPTKAWVNTRRFALGAGFVYQLTLWYRHEHGLDLRVGLKACLQAA
jgi:hypothetical protein